MLKFSYLFCNLYLDVDSEVSPPVVSVALGFEECSAVRVHHCVPVPLKEQTVLVTTFSFSVGWCLY